MSDVSAEVIDWCSQFAIALGVSPPTVGEIETLLDLAGIAAHVSQRQSAPVACSARGARESNRNGPETLRSRSNEDPRRVGTMDVRADYLRAVDAFEAVMMAVRDDQWDAQSPCEGWKALDVVGHLVGSLRMVSSLATTGAREMPFSEWPHTRVLAGDDPRDSFLTARAATERALTPENLTKVVDTEAGAMRLEHFLPMCTLDVTTHTWDLSQAIGHDLRLDPDLVHELFTMVEPFDDFVRGPGLFGSKVEPPKGADEQTQLLAFLGRTA